MQLFRNCEMWELCPPSYSACILSPAIAKRGYEIESEVVSGVVAVKNSLNKKLGNRIAKEEQWNFKHDQRGMFR